MFFAKSGDISALLRWYSRDANAPPILCLYVAGGSESERFIASVFDKRIFLDTLTGADIALFLFGQDFVKYAVPYGYQCDELHLHDSDLQRSQSETQLVVRRVGEIDLTGQRQRVVSASEAAANAMMARFRLSELDVPCFVLLSKDELDEPWVIPTKDAADIDLFVSFLRDLRSATQEAQQQIQTLINKRKDELAHLARLDEQMRSVRGLQHLEGELPELESEFKMVLTEFCGRLKNCGVPPEVLARASSRREADIIWKLAQRPDAEEPLNEFRSVVLEIERDDQEFWQRFKKLSKKVRSVRYETSQRTSENLRLMVEKERARTLASLRSAQGDEQIFASASARLEEGIQLVCDKYEQKLLTREATRPLIIFGMRLLRVARAGKDLTDILASIDDTLAKQ